MRWQGNTCSVARASRPTNAQPKHTQSGAGRSKGSRAMNPRSANRGAMRQPAVGSRLPLLIRPIGVGFGRPPSNQPCGPARLAPALAPHARLNARQQNPERIGPAAAPVGGPDGLLGPERRLPHCQRLQHQLRELGAAGRSGVALPAAARPAAANGGSIGGGGGRSWRGSDAPAPAPLDAHRP